MGDLYEILASTFEQNFSGIKSPKSAVNVIFFRNSSHSSSLLQAL